MQYSLYYLYAITFVSLLIVFYILLYSVIFVLRAQFASQTSGLCSAIPSAPVKSVPCFCYALVRTLFCVFGLTNTGFVQCYSLGSRKVVACLSLFCFIQYFFLLCVFCLTNIEFVQSSPFGSRRLLHAFVVSNLCFVLFASPTSGLCSAFPFGCPQVDSLLFFLAFVLFSLLLLCVLYPTSSGLCSDFPRLPSHLHA